jgi:predicted membrane GTPase involved in stress response
MCAAALQVEVTPQSIRVRKDPQASARRGGRK